MMMTRRAAAKKKSADLESEEESEAEEIKVAPLSKKEEADIMAEFAELDYMVRAESAKDVAEAKEAKAEEKSEDDIVLEESMSLSLERSISINISEVAIISPMQESVPTTTTAPMTTTTTSTAPMASAAMETAEMAPVTGEQLTTSTSAPMTSSSSMYPAMIAAVPRYSAPKESVELHASSAHYSAPPMQAAHVMPQPSAYNPYYQGKATPTQKYAEPTPGMSFYTDPPSGIYSTPAPAMQAPMQEYHESGPVSYPSMAEPMAHSRQSVEDVHRHEYQQYPSMVAASAMVASSEPKQSYDYRSTEEPVSYPMLKQSSQATEGALRLSATAELKSEDEVEIAVAPVYMGEEFALSLEDVTEEDVLCSPLGYQISDKATVKAKRRTGAGGGGVGGGGMGAPLPGAADRAPNGKTLQEIADAIFKVYNKRFRKKKTVRTVVIDEFALAGLTFLQRKTVANLVAAKKKKMSLEKVIKAVFPSGTPLLRLLFGMCMTQEEYIADWMFRALKEEGMSSKTATNLLLFLLFSLTTEEMIEVRQAFDEMAAAKKKKDLLVQIKSRFSSTFKRKRRVNAFFENVLQFKRPSDIEPINREQVGIDVACLLSMAGEPPKSEGKGKGKKRGSLTVESATGAAEMKKKKSVLSIFSSSKSSGKGPTIDKAQVIEIFSLRSLEHIAAVATQFHSVSDTRQSLLNMITKAFKEDSVTGLACNLVLMYATRRYQLLHDWFYKALHTPDKLNERLTFIVLSRSEKDLGNVIEVYGRDTFKRWFKENCEQRFPVYYAVICKLCHV